MHIDVWLAGNIPLGLFMIATVVAMVRANRIFVRDVVNDPDPGWRIVPKVAAISVVAFLVWGTFVDNWRQIVDMPYRLSQRFPSKRVEFDPTPDALRAVTFILIAASLMPVAALFARHVGGYFVQAVVLIGAVIFWAPLFAIRHRLDVNLALGFGGDSHLGGGHLRVRLLPDSRLGRRRPHRAGELPDCRLACGDPDDHRARSDAPPPTEHDR